MTTVIKKGGCKEAFVAAKIRRAVEKSAKEAKLSKAEIKELVKEVVEPVIALCKKKRTVKAAELRRSLLGRLERNSRKVATAWKKYDLKKKK
jgi:transcriptional regulator NrdR family protein